MSGSGKSTATAMTGPSRFRFVGEGLQHQRQRVFVAGPDEHDDDGAVVPRLQERRAQQASWGVDECGDRRGGRDRVIPVAHTVQADDRSRAAWSLRQRRGRPAHRAARCGSPDRYASSWTARPRRGRPSGAALADPWGRHGARRAPDGRDRTLTRRRPCAQPAHPRDSRRALPRTRRRTGASARPAATGPGAEVAAAIAACVKASTFSCHIRVYSRRSRALGGHPPVNVRAVRYPITSGAVQAISHICSQGAIQSVAEGTRVRRRAVRLRRVTLRDVAIPRPYGCRPGRCWAAPRRSLRMLRPRTSFGPAWSTAIDRPY